MIFLGLRCCSRFYAGMSQAADIEDFASIPPPSPARGSEHGSTPSSLKTWTVPRLMVELQRRGISYPASACRAELFRLLFPCASASYTSDYPEFPGLFLPRIACKGGGVGGSAEPSVRTICHSRDFCRSRDPLGTMPRSHYPGSFYSC